MAGQKFWRVDFAGHGPAGCRTVTVDFNSDSSKSAADETVAAVKAAGANPIAVQADLTKPENCAALFDKTVSEFGQVDIAINTTGMVIKKPIADVTEVDYDQIFAVNSKAAFFFIQEAGRKLAERGKICTIVSSLLALKSAMDFAKRFPETISASIRFSFVKNPLFFMNSEAKLSWLKPLGVFDERPED